MILPVMLPSPPITMISRTKYVILMLNVVEVIAPRYIARSPPEMPAKNELATNDILLCFARFIPMVSAAISSSLIALKARPYELFMRSTHTAIHTITTINVV